MRINLTQGAFRVLQRAEQIPKEQIPNTEKGISVLSVLLSLFEEPESRACTWLHDVPVTPEKLREHLGLMTTENTVDEQPLMEEPDNDPTPESNEEPRPIQGQDAIFKKQHTFYGSPFQKNRSTTKQPRSFLHWFLNEEPVRFHRIHPDFESAVYVMLNRVCKNNDILGTSLVQGQGGSVVKIKPNYNLGFLEPTFQIATEHLLLAIALTEDAYGVGDWLRGEGLDPFVLFQKIEDLYQWTERGIDDGPTGNETEPDWTRIFDDHNTVPEPPTITPPSSEHRHLLRILDASANRAHEAVRVIEDYTRFILDDLSLTTQLKTFRHDLTRLLQTLPTTERLHARNTDHDVGTTIQGKNEYQRTSPDDVLSSNFSRLQESLRSLEEYAKIISTPLAQHLEQLRYRSYSLQKTITLQPETPVNTSRQRLENARLYVLIDCRNDEETFSQLVQTLIHANADILQLRDKTASDQLLLSRGKLLRELTTNTGTLFIMNDRADLTILTQADGVHFGQDDLPLHEARRILGTEALIGKSTHSIEQARYAVAEGADYIGLGPVFPSATKSFETFPGLTLLHQAQQDITLPSFAIGGITLDNLNQILETGQQRVAVSSAIINANDPDEMVQHFKEKLARVGTNFS